MAFVDILMLVFFLLLFGISILKLKPFLSTTELKDDDRTPQSVALLYAYIFEVLEDAFKSKEDLTIEELFDAILLLESFDKEHFWRLNTNRIRLLVNEFYIQNPQVQTLQEMHKYQRDFL